MSKWLQKMMTPTGLLWLYALAFGIATGVGAEGAEMPKRAGLLASVTWSFLVSLWVTTDAHKRGRQLCYDCDSFVYFAWPLVVPVYLFQTRGVRAFLTLLGFIGIWIPVALVAAGVLLIREFILS